ncbi:MAG: helix-turn-helix domain-containing protein [Nannocystaceae bacterium]|nr:helix-turn-helix domain-containing protein [Nannocystaceae bacterium]
MKRRTADKPTEFCPPQKLAATAAPPNQRDGTAAAQPSSDDEETTACQCPQDARDGRVTFTVAELARLLGVGRDSIYDAANRGEIPGAVRIGRRRVFDRGAVLAWLRNPASSEK